MAAPELPAHAFDPKVSLCDDFPSLVEFVSHRIHLKKSGKTDMLDSEINFVPWSWLSVAILDVWASFYSNPVTIGTFMSEVQNRWDSSDLTGNKITVKHLLQEKFTRSAIFEAIVADITLIPGTQTYMMQLQDHKARTIAAYMHSKFNGLATEIKGRRVRLTGLQVDRGSYPSTEVRLLPTEFFAPISQVETDVIFRYKKTLAPYRLKNLPATPAGGSIQRTGVLALVRATVASQSLNDTSISIELQQVDLIRKEAEKSGATAAPLSRQNSDVDTRRLQLTREQHPLAGLFNTSEYLLLEDAFVADANPSSPLVYGSATVIHIIDKNSKGFDQLSQAGRTPKPVQSEEQYLAAVESSRCDRMAMFDYKHFPTRLTLRQLHPLMVNVTLLARVDPLEGIVRLGLILSDGSTEAPLALSVWGGLPPSLGLCATNCHNTELLIEGIFTNDQGKLNWKLGRGKITIVNRIAALLGGSLVGARGSLKQAVELATRQHPSASPPWCIARAKILGYTVNGPNLEALSADVDPVRKIHSSCHELLSGESSSTCAFCGGATAQQVSREKSLARPLVSLAYDLSWRLHDPSTGLIIDAFATKPVHEWLLQIYPDRWSSTSPADRARELNRIRSSEYEMVLAFPLAPSSTSTANPRQEALVKRFRIDQIAIAPLYDDN